MSAAEIARGYAAAEAATRAGRATEAEAAFEAVLALDPRQPRALNALAVRALARGDGARARRFAVAASAADPTAAELWLNRARAERLDGDGEAALASCDAALARDPYLVLALVERAQLRAAAGERALAARDYGAALAIVPPGAQLPPSLAAALEAGAAIVAAERAALADALAARLAGPRAAVDDAAAARFDHCVDALAGRRRIYPSQPTGLAYPGLAATEFFDRAAFPWLARLEAGTDAIRGELAGLLDGDQQGFIPYVAYAPDRPVNQWAELNHSTRWGAFFLWRDGEAVAANQARCPATTALLAELPLLDIAGRGPAAFFSLLRPRTRIPPHTGVTNIRAIVHLPLIVPPGCGFRVGATTREWRPGEAFAFDDTIEHEAWNDSDSPRAVLIVDAWNPALSAVERGLLRALVGAIDAHAGAASPLREAG